MCASLLPSYLLVCVFGIRTASSSTWTWISLCYCRIKFCFFFANRRRFFLLFTLKSTCFIAAVCLSLPFCHPCECLASNSQLKWWSWIVVKQLLCLFLSNNCVHFILILIIPLFSLRARARHFYNSWVCVFLRENIFICEPWWDGSMCKPYKHTKNIIY